MQDFYRPFTLEEEITPANQQKWPFYKHVAVHWDKYAGHGTAKIMKSAKRTKLTVADDEDRVDLNTDTLGLVAEHVSGKKMPELLSEVFDAFGAKYDGSIAHNSDHTSSACYGISISLRDYALFHQWLAQGKGPKSYYASARDASKTKIQENEFGALYSKGTPITYGSQTWYLAQHDILMSYGSYGQVGLSDMKTGVPSSFSKTGQRIPNSKSFMPPVI